MSGKKKTTTITGPKAETSGKKSRTQDLSNNLIFKISRLWTSPEGTIERVEIDAETGFDPKEIPAASHLEGELMFAKLKEEISVMAPELRIKIHFICNKCLKKFIGQVTVLDAERRFLAKKPKKFEDLQDTFLIDMKDLTVDLNEMLRQEIILHFPLVPVCSIRCKGLCAVCGKDRNKQPCKCEQEDPGTQQPFKNLKKLLH
jgi:uncharacterized protein